MEANAWWPRLMAAMISSGSGRPREGLETGVHLGNVPVDGRLKVNHRMGDAVLEALAGQLGEEALNCIEPRG